MSTINIQSEAVLVSLRISTWTARKYDRKVTDKVNKDHGAVADAGRYNKHLLPGDNETYKALVSHMSGARQRHYDQTLAWDDSGRRLLPHANNAAYRDFIADIKNVFNNNLYPAFRAAYPDLKDNARRLLNGMFVEDDYPTLSELDRKFSIAVDYEPVPRSDYKTTELSRPVIEEMERRHAEREQRLIETAVGDAWQRLYTCVESLQERLATPNAIFRNSLIVNLRDCCDVLSRLNVTHDPQLEKLRQTALDNIARYEPDTLRDNERTRATVARVAGSLMTEIRGIRHVRSARAA